jgi:hypothetical protein
MNSNVSFTEWLVTTAPSTHHEADPVIKYLNKINPRADYPTDVEYLADLLSYHEKFDKPESSEEAYAGLVYAVKLAWGDYERWRGV